LKVLEREAKMIHPGLLEMVCAKCGKSIGTILEPCPHCGYQHPLTEAGKELALERELEKHGYKLHKITRFKKHDRVSFGNRNIKISINLRSKVSQLALKTLIQACIGSKQK